MRRLYCPVIGHSWLIYNCKYLTWFGGEEAYYEGKCLKCDTEKEGLISDFERSGSVIFAEKMSRNTIPE